MIQNSISSAFFTSQIAGDAVQTSDVPNSVMLQHGTLYICSIQIYCDMSLTVIILLEPQERYICSIKIYCDMSLTVIIILL